MQTFEYHSKTIDITDIKLERQETYQEMSATVDGDRIWFRFPLFMSLEARAELFLAPAMVESMVRGIPVRITGDIAIDQRLAHTFEEIQSVFKSWNEDFIISPIIANTRDDFPVTEDVISCYSGGIDSSFTYGHYRDEITHIMLMQGFDDWDKNQNWQQNVANRQAFADAQGIKLIAVETNIRYYCEDRKLSHQLMFGSILASVAIIFNPRHLLIPSSYTYSTLHPLGSHPLLDPLWRTANTEIIHHGCASSRCKKTEYIAEHQDLLDQIQVCWKSSSSNCGNCPKCARTALTLKILGRKCDRLPEPTHKEFYEHLVICNKDEVFYIEELIGLCGKRGHGEIAKHLRRLIKSYKFKKFFHDIFKFLLGTTGRKLSRRFSKNIWYKSRATLTSNKIH